MSAIDFFVSNYAYIFLVGGLSGSCIYLIYKKEIDLFFCLLMGSVFGKALAFIFILIFGEYWFVLVIASLAGGLIGPILFNKPSKFNKTSKRNYDD